MIDEEAIVRATSSPNSELAVIGAVLMAGRKTLDALADIGFNPADFSAPKHEAVYRAAVALAKSGEPVETVSVAAKMGRELDRIGGPIILHDALQACVSSVSATFHARTVTEHAHRRRLIVASTHARELALSADLGAVGDAVDAAQAELAAVAEAVHGQNATDGEMDAALDDVLIRIETGGSPAIPTGIEDLDRVFVGGLQLGTLTTIAARPGVGKTVLGMQIALNIALMGGQVGYTSLEMSREDLLLRAVSAAGRVDYGRLQGSPKIQLTDSEWRAVRKATEEIRDSGLLVTRRTKATASAVRSDVRAMIRRRGTCTAWVIDYLGLVTPFDTRVIREQQVAGITRALKQTGLETGVPIILLSQLNREGEKSGRPPVLTDLRESGSIEQDSDNVILMHRDAEKRPDLLGVRVAKNRRGPLADFALTFEGSYQRATDKKWSPSMALDSNPNLKVV